MKEMYVQFSTRFPLSIAQWLDDYSKQTDQAKAKIIAQALTEYRERVEKEGK